MKKNLILDVDETLAAMWEEPTNITEINNIIHNDEKIFNMLYPINENPYIYDFTIYKGMCPEGIRLWGIERPGLREFLKYAFENFNVYIWSAGVKDYVNSMCYHIFHKNNYNIPKDIWNQSNCVKSTLENIKFHKPISKHIDLDPKNTLILDDRKENFHENIDNGILIPRWRPGDGKKPNINELLDRSDNNLKKFMDWYSQDYVRNCVDIRKINKDNIFK